MVPPCIYAENGHKHVLQRQICHRFDAFALWMDHRSVAFTIDMGLALTVFNGCVEDDQRILLGYTAYKNYCYCCAGSDRDDRRKVTKVFLMDSIDMEAWVPVSASELPNRMLSEMGPSNTVPCCMHGQTRSPPCMLALMYYTLRGYPPPGPCGCVVKMGQTWRKCS